MSKTMILYIPTFERSQHHLNSGLREPPHQRVINKRALPTASMLLVSNRMEGHLRWVILVVE